MNLKTSNIEMEIKELKQKIVWDIYYGIIFVHILHLFLFSIGNYKGYAVSHGN